MPMVEVGITLQVAIVIPIMEVVITQLVMVAVIVVDTEVLTRVGITEIRELITHTEDTNN